MKVIYHNNLVIKITLNYATKEYLFYINDLLNEMARQDPIVFSFSVLRPTKENVLDIVVYASGCTNEFKDYVFGVFNKLTTQDSPVFEYRTINYDSYEYSQENIEKENLIKCDKIFGIAE